MASLDSRMQNNAQLYHRLTQDLANEHDVSMEYEDVSSTRAAVSEKLKTLQVELNFLSQTAKKEYNDLHKARHFSVRSAAATLKGKKKALIAKEEAEYQQAFETEQQTKRKVDKVSSELATLSAKEKKLKDQKDHMINIRGQLEGLLDEVFAEPDGSQVLEPQLRAELLNYVDQTKLATRDLQRFRDTDHNLAQVLRSIAKAKEIAKVTLNYVPFDIFGTALIDEQQIIYVEACQRTTWECQRRLNIVRGILPEIPYPNTLDVVTGNHMLSLRFEGGYVDIAWKGKVQQGYSILVTAEKNIKSAMQWVSHYLGYTEGAIERLKVAQETTKVSLYNERRRIFDQALSATYGPAPSLPGSSSTTHVGSALVDDDVPPPVYEPPPNSDYNANHQQAPPEVPTTIGSSSTHLDIPQLQIPSPTTDSGRHLRTASQSSSITAPPLHSPQEPTPPTSTTSSNTDPTGHSYSTPNMNNPFRSSLQLPPKQ